MGTSKIAQNFNTITFDVVINDIEFKFAQHTDHRGFPRHYYGMFDNAKAFRPKTTYPRHALLTLIAHATSIDDYAGAFKSAMIEIPKYYEIWREHPRCNEALASAIDALRSQWLSDFSHRNDWHQDAYEYMIDLISEFENELGIFRVSSLRGNI